MNKKNLLLVLTVLFAIIGGIFIGNLLASRQNERSYISSMLHVFSRKNTGKIDEILKIVNTYYVDTINTNSITEDLAKSLIAKLDPHSVYIPATDLDVVNSELEGSFSGIGVQFNIQNDTVMIVSVISGGPAEQVGLLAGDRLIEVNDTLFVGTAISSEKVFKKLRGTAGTKVKVGIKRYGTDEILQYDITRGSIPVKSVAIAYMIKPEVGFIRVDKFAATTYSEFLSAIAELRNQGAKKYIIDLRENSGGLMDQAINMVNEFLPKGQLIVYAEGISYPRFESKANGKGSCINVPIEVLIDDFSASASEIFAGAIQDNDRGLIIGRRSFGKGLVQQQIPLNDGSAVRLTVARYYTPSGRSIQKPYEIGKSTEYEMDITNRFMHGEFYNADSIHMADSLKYKTLNGRIVFGGGGIMPDIFVPRDTSEYSHYLNKVSNYGYLYQYAFQYTDQNREKLKPFKTCQQMEKFLDSQNLLNDFVIYATRKGIPGNWQQINISKKYILNTIKAYIIRNMLGDIGFYPVLYQRDNVVEKALKEFDK